MVPTASGCCVLCVVVASLGAGSGEVRGEQTRGVTLEIGPSMNYTVDGPISIRCVLKNPTDREQTISLKEHDKYHGRLPYATSVTAKVIDAWGTVLTRERPPRDNDWWTFYTVWSTVFLDDMPGDRVTMPPGSELVRRIPLREVLLGCPSLEEGLPAGLYDVQVSIDGIISNVLQIRIRDK